MPGRTYTAASSYRYGFNGKEMDNEVKGEGNQQDYGMRIYDPRLGRFLSVDPLTPFYPWYTPYQFAGNKPIWCIDLDGLEEKSATTSIFKTVFGSPSGYSNPRTALDIMSNEKLIIQRKVQEKWNNSRVGRFTNGLINTTMGLVGTVASLEYITTTGGVGAALGGTTALMFSLSETGIGLAQMVDAIAGNNPKSEILHNSSSVVGLIAYGTDSKYAPFLDAIGGLAPTTSTAKSLKEFVKDLGGFKGAFNAFVESPTLVNTLGAIDQILDNSSVIVEAINLVDNHNTGTSRVTSQTLNYKLTYSVKEGDNLTSIAKIFNTTVEELAKQNNISDVDKINVNQKISYSNSITEKVKKNP
jgi:RHS repeat-associated protein